LFLKGFGKRARFGMTLNTVKRPSELFGKRARFGMTLNTVKRPSELFGKRARFGMLERSDSNHKVWDD
jgi:hypothetical protein